MQKRWTIQQSDVIAVQALQEQLQIHPIFCQLLVQMGISNYQEAQAFFRPSLDGLHDPFLMKGMAEAVTRIAKALDAGEKILIYGDYDVDGTTSVALMYSFLDGLEARLDYYIPDRYKEGYGLSFQGIEYAKQQDVSLLITLDCGVRAVKPIALARREGIDVIVCDHHEPGEELPDAIVLDPKQSDCEYPYRTLSGCGVGLKLAQGVAQQRNLPNEHWLGLLDLVAISIAADLVPMTGENRILAYYGLQQLTKTKRKGLRTLITRAGKQLPLSISDIVFGIAPLINAAGRLADAEQAVRLLLANTKQNATELTNILEYRNQMRREFDERISAEAKELFLAQADHSKRKSVVLYQSHWHKGVVGITASRMVDAFYRPTVILTASEGKAVGSARSVRGFDVHDALKACDDLLINYGGHKYAAGMTLRTADVPAFQDRFEAVVRSRITDEDLVPLLRIAAELNLEDLSAGFWKILKQFAPFGPQNRNPVFMSRGVRDSGYSKILKGAHLSVSIRQGNSEVFNGIGFGMGDHYDLIKGGKRFDICYSISENRWKGKVFRQLMVKDVRASE